VPALLAALPRSLKLRALDLVLLAGLSFGAPAVAAPVARELPMEFCWDHSPCTPGTWFMMSNGRFEADGYLGSWSVDGDQITFRFDVGTIYGGRSVAPGCWEGLMTDGGGFNGTWSMSASWAVCPS